MTDDYASDREDEWLGESWGSMLLMTVVSIFLFIAMWVFVGAMDVWSALRRMFKVNSNDDFYGHW